MLSCSSSNQPKCPRSQQHQCPHQQYIAKQLHQTTALSQCSNTSKHVADAAKFAAQLAKLWRALSEVWITADEKTVRQGSSLPDEPSMLLASNVDFAVTMQPISNLSLALLRNSCHLGLDNTTASSSQATSTAENDTITMAAYEAAQTYCHCMCYKVQMAQTDGVWHKPSNNRMKKVKEILSFSAGLELLLQLLAVTVQNLRIEQQDTLRPAQQQNRTTVGSAVSHNSNSSVNDSPSAQQPLQQPKQQQQQSINSSHAMEFLHALSTTGPQAEL